MSGGITFDETMSGWFTLGDITDPETAADQGRQDNAKLAMHASIRIPDIETFLEDPDHAGELSGSVDYAPLGSELRSEAGVFNLFAPADQPETKLMVYELALSSQDGPLYIAGHKVVRQDAGFDLWSDTTTLYTRLYRGANKSGRVIGAGVLRLGIAELMNLLSTLKSTSDGSKTNILKFGKLFFGELWEVYAPHIR